MTSTTGAAGHPDVEEISALTEGLLSISGAAEVRRHLATCRECAEVHASLEEIRSLLGTLTVPTGMPEDVADRVDAALAAEALLADQSSAPTAPRVEASPSASKVAAKGHEPVGRPSRSESADHVSRETSVPDAPASPFDRPAGHPRAATGPGRATRRRFARRRSIALGTVFTAAAIGLGTLLFPSAGHGPSSDTATGPSASHSSDAGQTFSSGDLGAQVSTLLSSHSQSPKSGEGSPEVQGTDPSLDMGPADGAPSQNSTLRDMETRVRIPECIQEGIGRTEPPLAAEQGFYEGTAAYLVVLPHATDRSRVSAYVVDASCVQQPVIQPGKVLLAGTYSRN